MSNSPVPASRQPSSSNLDPLARADSAHHRLVTHVIHADLYERGRSPEQKVASIDREFQDYFALARMLCSIEKTMTATGAPALNSRKASR